MTPETDPDLDPPADRHPGRQVTADGRCRRGLDGLDRAGDRRRCRRPCRAPLPRILRRHHPQQEHPHGLLPGRRARSSPGANSTSIGELADIEPLHVAAYIEALQQRLSRSRRSSSTWPRSACCSTGWSSARSLATNPAHAVRGPKHVVKTRQDPGADRRPGAHAARQHRHLDPRRPARPRADRAS